MADLSMRISWEDHRELATVGGFGAWRTRVKPPPSGNGSWKQGSQQSVKDRWVFHLRPDQTRADILRVKA